MRGYLLGLEKIPTKKLDQQSELSVISDKSNDQTISKNIVNLNSLNSLKPDLISY